VSKFHHQLWKEKVVPNKERIAAGLDRLEAERDALAARVQEMREAIKKCRFDSLNMTFADLDYIKRAFATPDTSAQILKRRDAAIWMEAAEVCALKRYATDCSYALRAKADELLRGLEKEHGLL